VTTEEDANDTLTPLAIALLALLVLAAILNYIDRQSVSAIAPTLRKDLKLSGAKWIRRSRSPIYSAAFWAARGSTASVFERN